MSEILKKKDLFKKLFRDSCVLACPICKDTLSINNDSLVCKNNHTFDINKKGYSCLLKKQKKFYSDVYTKDLFLNRRKVISSGLYDQLHNEIAEFINCTSGEYAHIFEIGSGESTHSFLIKEKLQQKNNYIVSDLSNYSVELSTDYLNNGILPIVCDLYNLPILTNSIDYIIDILSPYFYKEVYRILKTNGYIIKVFPAKDYLIELRNLINMNDYEKQEEVFNNFCKYFNIIQEKSIHVTANINSTLASCIFKMTPMTNNHETNSSLNKITINLRIVLAQKII